MIKKLINILICINLLCIPTFADVSDSVDDLGDNTVFNKNLAVYCMENCIAADDEGEITSKLSSEFWQDITTYNYDIDSEDNAGFSLARRDNTVVLTIRQTYDKEWYGNFNIADNGITERHESFNKAAEVVVLAVKEYINVDDTTLIVTGYSRGAAVANLVARDLKGCVANIYAYTFATPACTTNVDENCDYIFNVINPEDFITLCPLPQWGYERYGRDVILPVSGDDDFTELYKNMNVKYKALTGTNYKYFGNDEPTEFAENAVVLASDVSEYYDNKYFVYSFGDTSLRAYFEYIATILCEDGNSKEWSAAYQFLQNTQGTRLKKLTKFVIDNYLNGKIFAAHNANTYYSWLFTLDEDYFSETITGDADNDGIVTANDAAFVLEKAMNLDFELPVEKYVNYMKYVDIDGNQNIDANDAAGILQLALGA